MRNLVILSTQRSGSTMVCDDFAGTNVLGRPSEYFIKVIENINNSSKEELKKSIETALDKGRTENGVISIKVMANQINSIGKAIYNSELCEIEDNSACFYEFFKDFVFARVKRKDKIAQAVSRVMAKQTDVYHAVDKVDGVEGMIGKFINNQRDETKVIYDFNEINSELSKIKQEEEFIDQFLNKYSIPYIDIQYEDAVQNRSYVISIANKMGVNNVNLLERRLKRVSGKKSEEWVERFKKESNIV